MKKLLLILLLVISLKGYGQYDTIHVGMTTSIHLIYPSNVLKYDVGSGVIQFEDGTVGKEVLISHDAENAADRIKLAAYIQDFATTNLLVETEAAFYNYILAYTEFPSTLFYDEKIEKAVKVKDNSTVTKTQVAEGKEKMKIDYLEGITKKIVAEPNRPGQGAVLNKMLFYINGIYTRGDFIFVRVNFENTGDIKFDLGYEGFFIRDKKNKGTKETTQQDEPVEASFIFNNNVKVIRNEDQITKVYAFPKFTIERKKVFILEFWEDKGERKVEIELKSEDILNARSI